MRFSVLVFFFCLSNFLSAQNTFTPDTLRAKQRALGNTDSLLQYMNGFSAPFFINPVQSHPRAWQLFAPGVARLTAVSYPSKKLCFSALPHLGFAYGFGAQGVQRLRLDYEQQIYKNTLFNLRYDRHQSTGFLRASDIRYSGLQIQVLQKFNRLQLLAGFAQLNNDRQWSGGIANWSALAAGNAALLPTLKDEAFSFENGYSAQVQSAYFLGKDSTKGFRLISQHRYENKLRRYEETDSLALFYPQLYLNSDSCRDRFASQSWSNAVGLGFVGPKIDWNSTLQIKQLNWQDTQLAYDTTEFNLQNEFHYATGAIVFKHQSTFNFIGAGRGQQALSKLELALPFGKLHLIYDYRNAWPELLQRTYMSNLTQYQQMQPQREKVSHYTALMHLEKNSFSTTIQAAYMRAKQIYRFSFPSMGWQLEGPQQAFEASINTSYPFGPWRIAAGHCFTYWQRSASTVLPPHRSQLKLQWAGGVFKNKALQLHAALGLEASYGGATMRLHYLPFIESIDWQVYGSPSVDLFRQFYNAQVDLALEVKTFRFFVQATNLLSTVDYTSSLYSGVPYPTFQLRLGLTWDFWN